MRATWERFVVVGDSRSNSVSVAIEMGSIGYELILRVGDGRVAIAHQDWADEARRLQEAIDDGVEALDKVYQQK